MTGHFWEGRYKLFGVKGRSHRLNVMGYIDINPFAANMCDVPEDGDWTTLKDRVIAYQKSDDPQNEGQHPYAKLREEFPELGYKGYLNFIDKLSKKFRQGKQQLSEALASISERLKLAEDENIRLHDPSDASHTSDSISPSEGANELSRIWRKMLDATQQMLPNSS